MGTKKKQHIHCDEKKGTPKKLWTNHIWCQNIDGGVPVKLFWGMS